jgi:hypothetical protein
LPTAFFIETFLKSIFCVCFGSNCFCHRIWKPVALEWFSCSEMSTSVPPNKVLVAWKTSTAARSSRTNKRVVSGLYCSCCATESDRWLPNGRMSQILYLVWWRQSLATHVRRYRRQVVLGWLVGGKQRRSLETIATTSRETG